MKIREYKINEEELCELLSRAYQEGYDGYQDLGESVARKLAKKFLKDRPELAHPEWVSGDKLQNSVTFQGSHGQQWTVEEGAHVTITSDVGSPDGSHSSHTEIILPDTTLNSWYNVGDQEV